MCLMVTCVQHLESKHEGVEYDDVVDSFSFVQPNGCLQLLLQTPQEPGWTVNPDRKPLKVKKQYIRYSLIALCSCSSQELISFPQPLHIQLVVYQYMLNLVLYRIHFIVLLN